MITLFLDFEVDSGAAVTLLPMNVYNAELSGFLLQPSEVRLITANGKSMKTMGKIIVNISIKDHYYNNLPLVITDNSLKKPLLGRDWLDIVNPLWRSQIVCTKQVEVLW